MFTKGQPSPNPAGRPAGSETTVAVPKHVARTVIRQLGQRAKNGDPAAVDALALLLVKEAGR